MTGAQNDLSRATDIASSMVKEYGISERILVDIIVAVEGKPVVKMADFVQMLQTFEIGKPINLQERRGDTVRDVVVTIMDIS